jgi:hypothetical protein
MSAIFLMPQALLIEDPLAPKSIGAGDKLSFGVYSASLTFLVFTPPVAAGLSRVASDKGSC